MNGSFTPAGNSTLALSVAIQLFAGEAPITTNRAEGGSEVNLEQYTVIAIVDDKIVAWNPAGEGGYEIAAGILATPLNTTTDDGTPGTWAPYYTGGDFNHEALEWPVAIDTLAERRAAFAPVSTIKISALV